MKSRVSEDVFAQRVWVLQGRFRMRLLLHRCGKLAEDPWNRNRLISSFDRPSSRGPVPLVRYVTAPRYVQGSDHGWDNAVRCYEDRE